MSNDSTNNHRDLTGATFGDYRILRRLGRGAMAEVYLAEQVSLNRQVAMKVLKHELAQDDKSVRRFRNEATAAAALVHGSIVQIYEVGEHDGLHYISQEYVPGGTVGDLIRKNGSLEPKSVISILRQVAAALARAASEGIVHRDIKPENILLTPSGEVKVADFGLARVAVREGVDMTQAGVAMGTPLYMSPEQIEGRTLSPASDIYSLGVTAFHMLAGRPPFTGETPLSVAVQHLNSKPPRLEDERRDVPPGLARIIHKMLAKEADKRYAGGSELLVDLRSEAKEIAGLDDDWEEWSTAEMAAITTAKIEATAQLDRLMKDATQISSQRHMWGWWVAVMILAVGIGMGLAMWSRPSPVLAEQSATTAIEKQQTVLGQLYYAKVLDTPAAWNAVGDHHPDEPAYYHHLAQQGLALYYMRKDPDLDRALELFEQLAKVEGTEEVSAFGLAGMAIVNSMLGNRSEQEQALGKLVTTGKVDKLSRPMRDLLLVAMEESNQQMNQRAQENLRELMDLYQKPENDEIEEDQ